MTTPIDIRADHLRIVHDVLARHLPDGVKVWVFGSRATWATKDSSDLDLALEGDAQVPARSVSALESAFEDSDLPYAVDVVDVQRIAEPFRRIVTEQRVPLPGSAHHSRFNETIDHARNELSPDVETRTGWRRRDVRALVRERVLVVGDGYRAKNSELSSSGLPFARAGNIADGFRFSAADRFPEDRLHRVGDKTSRPGDVVFTSKGTVGRFAYVRRDTEPFVYSPQLCFWRSLDPEVIDQHFLYCWVRGAEFFGQFKSVAGDTDMAEYVSLTDQRRMFITLPPLPQQRAIAHILGTLDDKIELNRRMNATLEAMARALFKSWLVDFDPVRAKMEGRDTGLPKEIADLFPDRLVDSELGEIPEGWEVATLGDHVVNFDSKRIPVSGAVRAERSGPYPYHGAAGVLDHVDDYIFDGVFLLLGEDGSVMRENGLAVTQYVYGKFWVNNHAHVLQGAGPVSTEQAYLHFSFEPVAPLVTGAVQPKLSQSRMKCVPFLFAGDDICRAFAEIVQPWFAQLRSRTEETRILAEMRDELLPILVSGRLQVSIEDAPRLDARHPRRATSEGAA